MKYRYLVFIFLLFLIGCTSSYDGKSVAKRYDKLNKKFEQLTDDEVDEQEREDLEKKFRNFSKDMREYKLENPKEDTQYLNEYIKKAIIKLQYLKDLKD